MKSLRNTRGFTIIEAMSALVVFAVATTGLVAMQRAATSGAEIAGQQTAATNIARAFLVQLQSEIAHWPEDDHLWPPSAESFFLSEVGSEATGIWIQLESDSGSFRVDEFLGHLGTDNEGSVYCVNYMITPMENETEIKRYDANYNELRAIVWKINVRIAWPKPGRYEQWENCAPASIDTRLADNLAPYVVELMGVGTRELSQ